MGIPLSDGMFKLNDQAAYSQPLAVERVSEIANKAPNVRDGSIVRGMNTVKSICELLLMSAQPVNAAAMVSVGQAKRDANFDDTLGSLSGVPDERFRPVYSTPADWYDAGNATAWTAHTVGDSPPAPPPKPPPIRLGPPIWRVLPVEERAVLATPASFRLPLLASEPGPSTAFGRVPSPTRLAPAGPSAAHPLMAMVSVASHLPPGSTVKPAAAPPAATVRPLGLTHATATLVASATVASVTAETISMSFEHCIVMLNRPWFPNQLVLLRDWYLPGYGRGEISAGTGDNDDGLMTVFTTGFVATLNLKITSHWSAQDLSVIAGSAAFGPFSLLGRSFDQASGTLSSPGMQIIGWFCSALPVLPPAPDPALSTPTGASPAR